MPHPESPQPEPSSQETERSPKEELAALKARTEEFRLELEQAAKTGDLTRARSLKAELQARTSRLKERIQGPEVLTQVEAIVPNFREQYQASLKTLTDNKLVSTLESGSVGIKAIDGQEYPLPSLEEVAQRLVAYNRETKQGLETKHQQGFAKLVLVPFGSPLKRLTEAYQTELLTRFVSKTPTPAKGTDYLEPAPSSRLRGSNGELLPVHFENNQLSPLWVWDELNKAEGADAAGEMLYNPTSFPKNQDPKVRRAQSAGQTKLELLAKEGAFQVYLVEADAKGHVREIPRAGTNEVILGRKRLEAGLQPRNYLATHQHPETDLKQNPYHLEQGMTPELAIILNLQHLRETDQVLDDWDAKDSQGNPVASINFLTGAYLPASDYVPTFYWNRVNRQASLGRSSPGAADGRLGVRPAVRVKA